MTTEQKIKGGLLKPWYGLSMIGFIYHGDYADPELEYKGACFNIHAIEDALYDSCNGGGSLMEIELEKDVKIPLQFVNSIKTNDSFQNVYGMDLECWKDTLKTVKIA